MDRRVLAALLTFAHVCLAGAVVAGMTLLASGAWAVIVELEGPQETAPSSSVFFALALAMLLVWWIALIVLGVSVVRRAVAASMRGDFAGASERLRRMFDREPFLRIAGMNGSVWRSARIAEAYNDFLHGLHGEAIEIGLAASTGWRTTPLRRSAATVVAAAAGDSGDDAPFAQIAPHLAWARRKPAHIAAQSMLAGEGFAWALQSRLAPASARADEILAAAPGSRMGLLLRALVRNLGGDLEGALADVEAARASPLLAKAKPAQRALVQQTFDSTRAELLRELGRLEEAAALARTMQAEPLHRIPRLVSVSIPGLAAAVAGDAVAARLAVSALEDLRERWSFEPIFRARVAIATSRIERAAGAPARALAALPDAIACPLAVLRQEGLLEQAEARAALGDEAGVRASLAFVLEISKETRHSEAARRRLGVAA